MYLANKSAQRHQNPKDEEINIDWGWGVVCSENCMEEAGTGIRGKNPYILSAGDPASRGQHLEVKDLGAEEEQAAEKNGARAAPSLRARPCCSYTTSSFSPVGLCSSNGRSGGDACGARKLLAPQINACNLRLQFLVSFWLCLVFAAA